MYIRYAGVSCAGSPHDAASICLVLIDVKFLCVLHSLHPELQNTYVCAIIECGCNIFVAC